MTQLTPDAQKRLSVFLKTTAAQLKNSGKDSTEISMVISGLDEQVHEIALAENMTDVEGVETILQELDMSDITLIEDKTFGPSGLGKISLFLALITLFGIIFAAPIAEAIGMDGGAVMSTFVIFGAPAATLLGYVDKETQLAKAGMVLSAAIIILFTLIIGMALIGG
ncbi:MAG: hypothetical protein ACWA5L_02900 [bacterium]